MSKAIMATAFAVSLLYGTSALAQHDDHHGGDGGGQHGGGGGAPHGGGGGGAPHYAAPSGGGQHYTAPAGGGAHSGGGQTYTGGQHTQSYTPSYGGGQYPHRGASPYTGGAAQGQQYSHPLGGYQPQGGRGQDNYRGQDGGRGADAYRGNGGERGRYNEREFPHAIQAERQYHWRGDWNPPRGFYYRHWGYGDRLPYGWYGRDYWITDFWFYGLPYAPYGYAWVREGPDAVLVNVYDGQVVEVEYGVFY